MYTFPDYYANQVTLSFDNHPFSKHPGHVFVICRYQNKWLLTRHSDRGLEFPGGKVELGENAEMAAKREVLEETGGHVTDLSYIGQYKVIGKSETIIKNIYTAEVGTLEKQMMYYETDGPVTKQILPENIKQDPEYSFIMQDDVVPCALEQMNASK